MAFRAAAKIAIGEALPKASPDGTQTVVGGYGIAINKNNGQQKVINPPAQNVLNDRATAGGYGEHPEGSTVQDKTGKQYKIINGQPVPQ